jgi:undecaprenyl-diphosphatase
MVVLPILGEALLDVKKIAGGELGAMDSSSLNITALIVGFIAAFIVGCMACRWMIDLVKKGKLIWFAVYCLIVGVVCLIFQ